MRKNLAMGEVHSTLLSMFIYFLCSRFVIISKLEVKKNGYKGNF